MVVLNLLVKSNLELYSSTISISTLHTSSGFGHGVILHESHNLHPSGSVSCTSMFGGSHLKSLGQESFEHSQSVGQISQPSMSNDFFNACLPLQVTFLHFCLSIG